MDVRGIRQSFRLARMRARPSTWFRTPVGVDIAWTVNATLAWSMVTDQAKVAGETLARLDSSAAYGDVLAEIRAVAPPRPHFHIRSSRENRRQVISQLQGRATSAKNERAKQLAKTAAAALQAGYPLLRHGFKDLVTLTNPLDPFVVATDGSCTGSDRGAGRAGWAYVTEPVWSTMDGSLPTRSRPRPRSWRPLAWLSPCTQSVARSRS